MSSLFYITTRLKRSPHPAVLMAVLIGLLCMFSTLFAAFIAQKEGDIEAAYDALPVTLVVSNLTGTRASQLNIYENLVDCFLSDRYVYGGEVQPRALSSYLKDVAVKATFYYTTPWDPTTSAEKMLSGLTAPALAVEFPEVEGLHLSYFSGWDAALFDGAEPVCVVPEALLIWLEPDGDGRYFLELTVRSFPASSYTGQIRLEVAGTHPAQTETIYCPWEVLYGPQRPVDSMIMADFLRAAVRDNRELDELRVLLARHFDEVSPTGTQGKTEDSSSLFGQSLAITVHDETLRETLNAQNRNLQTLYRLKPVFTVLELVLSAIALFFYFHIRRKELAVARSLGTSRKAVLAAVLLETALLCLLGVLLGLTPLLLGPSIPVQGWTIVGILFFALAGAALSGLAASGRKAFQLLKEVE